MEPHIIEWLNLAVRWMHITIGIAWIGASFYFNWLENSLNRQNQREGIAGSLWAIHGGGFYYLEKYQLAPEEIPKKLHWFKYEAYFTWVTGFLLLGIVYYLNASLYLVDSASPLTPLGGVGVGIATLLLSWIGYDLLCKSPLGNNNKALGIIGFIAVTGIAFALSQVFTPRAAYIHVGALLGTCMAANVFFGIIPAQKALVEAAESGGRPDPMLGKKAGQRSLHNNYMTMPVLFIMISNHFPSTYGHEFNWAMLAGISIVGVGVRHWFNLKGRGEMNMWLLPASAIGLIALSMVAAPRSNDSLAQNHPPVTFAEAYGIVQNRCVSCHGASPTDDLFTVAPAGVMLDTPEQMKAFASRIKMRAVDLKTMPFSNKSGMTDEERVILGAWVDQGAIIE